MRILALDLLAYGPFSGTTLDFSAEGRLHLVYGPNEAGKSAALRALRALLYGIPVRTADNFRHDNRDLRIGGRLRLSDGAELAFVRRKGSKHTLLGPDGQPLGDDALHPYLGGVSAEGFAKTFGIGHEDLLRGGQELAAGGGEAGESLFAAAVGGSGLHRVLAALEAEADALFRPRGSTQALNRELAGYRETCRAVTQLSLSSREYEELRKALEETRGTRDEVAERLRVIGAERNRLERLAEALPVLAEREEMLRRRRALGAVRRLREDFAAERRELARERQGAVRAAESAAADRTRVAERRATLCPPAGLLELGDEIAALHERLGGHREAVRQLPVLERERDQLLAESEVLLREIRPDLDLAGAEGLRLTATRRARILDLGGRHAVRVRDREAVARTVATLTAKIVAATAEREALGPAADPGPLRAVVERVQVHGDLTMEREAARAVHRAARARAEAALSRLPGWGGSLDDLAEAALPVAATVDRFEAGFEDVGGALRRCRERRVTAGERELEVAGQLQALAGEGEVPSEERLAQAREHRQAGWTLVRRAWLDGVEEPGEVRTFAGDAPLSEAYEQAVAEADGLADRLRREAGRVSRQAALRAEREQVRRELEAATAEREGLMGREAVLAEEWRALWSPLGVAPLPPREMRAWRAAAEALIQRAEEVHEKALALARLEERIRACGAELEEALRGAGVSRDGEPEELPALLERAHAAVRRLEEAERRRRSLEATVTELEAERAAALREGAAADEELGRWRTRWAEALAGLGLGDEPTPAETQAFLDRSQELFQRLDEARRLGPRIDSIRRDVEAFTAAARDLAARAAPDLGDAPPEPVAAELNGRLGRAREEAAVRVQLDARLRDLDEQLREARAVVARTSAGLDALCEEAGCRSWDELDEAERRSAEARALDGRILLLEEKILAHSGGATVAAFLRAAAEIDPDLLPERVRELGAEIEQLEARLSTLHEEVGKQEGALARLDGTGEAAEAAERAQGVLSRLRAGAERYVRVRLAASILRREIERYRARNQGPVVERASALFAHLTLGSFREVRTEYDERDVPRLVGVRPSGVGVGVEGMSDGTRDQLYLALRVATLERHLAGGEPLPFLVDDVLINFDDDRSRATLEVLAALSRETQVVYFTHHAHLVEIARAAVGEDRLGIQELGGAPPAAAGSA